MILFMGQMGPLIRKPARSSTRNNKMLLDFLHEAPEIHARRKWLFDPSKGIL